MDALGPGKGAGMPDSFRAEMRHEGIHLGTTRSLYFAGGTGGALLVRLIVAAARGGGDFALLWAILAVLAAGLAAALWAARRKDAGGTPAMALSLTAQALCLLTGVALATVGGVSTLPYAVCVVLFAAFSSYRPSITLPILAAAHGVFVVLLARVEGGNAAVLIDYTAVPVLAAATLIIAHRSRRHAFANARLTADLTRRNDDLTALNRRLKALMLVDEMTGVANRRGFDRDAELSWQHCRRQDLSLGICFMDIDHFRTVNERHGRTAGNECLVALAQRLTMSLKRSVDVAARLGGEEFALLLPFTDAEGALIVTERVRSAIEEFAASYPIVNEFGESSGVREEVHVTASIGFVVGYPAHDRLPVSELMRRAEHALRVAKRVGGNRVIPWKEFAPGED